MKILLILGLVLGTIFPVFSQDLASTTIEMTKKVEAFPNPTSELLFLKNAEDFKTFQVFDANGKVVLQGQLNANIISVAELPIGFYLLQLRNENTVESVRFQKY